MPLDASFLGDVPLVEFIYLVYMPGAVTVGDSGLCCYVPYLSSAIISLCTVTRLLSRGIPCGESRCSSLGHRCCLWTLSFP